jgi:cephalosporin hydroxylase
VNNQSQSCSGSPTRSSYQSVIKRGRRVVTRTLKGVLTRVFGPALRWREKRLIRGFHCLYYNGPLGGRQLFYETEWFGVPVLKCPLDLFVYQEILYRTRPDVIVETGTNQGGSALYLAHLCDLLGNGQVVSVELDPVRIHERARSHPRIKFITGSSIDADVVRQVAGLCAGRRAMVILDSDHSRAHVLEELRMYSALVAPGCYLICEDTNVNGHPCLPDYGPGPFEAVQTFLAESNEWEVDRGCEKLLVTFNPSGYLVKVG